VDMHPMAVAHVLAPLPADNPGGPTDPRKRPMG
jgi:hypothetical protein